MFDKVACLNLLRRLFRMLPMITPFWHYLGQPHIKFRNKKYAAKSLPNWPGGMAELA